MGIIILIRELVLINYQFSGEFDGSFTVAISLAGATPTKNTNPFKPWV